MLNEREIKLQARLAAVENLLSLFISLQLAQGPYSDADIAGLLQGIIAKMRDETFAGIDPATSDLLASEVEQATKMLTDDVSARVAALRFQLGR